MPDGWAKYFSEKVLVTMSTTKDKVNGKSHPERVPEVNHSTHQRGIVDKAVSIISTIRRSSMGRKKSSLKLEDRARQQMRSGFTYIGWSLCL